MRTQAERLMRLLLDALFPRACLGCDMTLRDERRYSVLCGGCEKLLVPRTAPTCPTCGARRPLHSKPCHAGTPYTLAAAAGYDEPIIQSLVWNLKYARIRDAAMPLARLVAEHVRLAEVDLRNTLVVPVPLHRSRERHRGFNQAELLGEAIARGLELPYAPVLVRIRSAAPQATARDARARTENVGRSFSVPEAAHVSGKHVLLVDDVHTSGATARACAAALREAGAERITVAVPAVAT
jgi:ComF family protein